MKGLLIAGWVLLIVFFCLSGCGLAALALGWPAPWWVVVGGVLVAVGAPCSSLLVVRIHEWLAIALMAALGMLLAMSCVAGIDALVSGSVHSFGHYFGKAVPAFCGCLIAKVLLERFFPKKEKDEPVSP